MQLSMWILELISSIPCRLVSMKIPFFYLEVGELSIFQPQNRQKGFRKYNDQRTMEVHSSSNPDCSVYNNNSGTLYLNGDNQRKDFLICKTHFKIDGFIELLKTIEVDNV